MIKSNYIKQTVAKINLILVKNQVILKYRQRFRNKQMRFLISKILILFDTNYSINKLAEVEIELMNSNFQKNMFLTILLNHVNSIDEKFQSCDWKSFGKFLYYIFKTSTYYYDVKHQVPNIFEIHGITSSNARKRDLFNDFCMSLEKVIPDFNYYVRLILKWVK
ncbi:hypothetical protein ACWXVL_01350 [Mycoplasma sp. 128]